MKTYSTFCFEKEPDWAAVPVADINCFNWEKELGVFYRPESHFQMCFVKEKGVWVKMNSKENNIRRVCHRRDENVYEDSCLEFFFKPFTHRDEYVNFEINLNCAYLSQFGKSRENRKFIKELTNLEPQIKTGIIARKWSVELFLPCDLISEIYSEKFNAFPGIYYGNFYKCGDKTIFPHYGSYSPMGDVNKGFHDPNLFAKLIVEKG